MARIGFRERLAFVRWLRAKGRTALESDAELAVALGVGYKWLQKWKTRAEAPEGRTEHDAIAKALKPLGVPVRWLYDGSGAQPWPDLWAYWSDAMRDLGTDELNAPKAPPLSNDELGSVGDG